ncbi:helix-turn-helix transcriptional regulator [Roseobacter sinensis]|uniref:LuxR family transcriptional regulator n=1 Tax=Roseobacter sinensis TaxID=2931391 RepID=A0ABT3B9V2_9RHOB|nr:LuxR family transcriptional regulator [Roseobacter sp. WL0113]MCV3270341.1 LuxR family transcriptional regulator [Roseobacter sp. WL0113]
MIRRQSLTQFAQSCKSAQRLPDLWQRTIEHFTACGIQRVSYHSDDQRYGADDTHGIATFGFPEDWVCRYLGDNLMQVDPIPDLAARFSRPFLWSHTDQITELMPAQADYLRDLEDADLGDGLAVQVFGPNMRHAYMGMGFGHTSFNPSPEQVFELQCAAQIAHIRYCEITADSSMAAANLSPREREILRWIAHGKSNSVIADILGISPHTVDTLTRRIFDKLDVSDRTSAAIRGLGSGVLRYSKGTVT